MCTAKSGGGSKKKTTKRNTISSKGDIAGANKYDQKYWANQIKPKSEGGAGRTQTDVLNQQEKLGIKKSYSGDKVVTTANKDTAHFKLEKLTGSDATLQNKGVTKNIKKSGLFGENTDTTYDYAGNNPDVVTKATDHGILGGRTSTTYVDGTATNTITNKNSNKNGVGTKTTLANADDVDDTVVADTVVGVSGSTNTAGGAGTLDILGHKTYPYTAGGTTGTTGGTTGTVVTPVKPTVTGGGAAAGNSVQPDAIKNQLSVKRRSKAKGKRGVRTNTAQFAGRGRKGNTSLNIPT